MGYFGYSENKYMSVRIHLGENVYTASMISGSDKLLKNLNINETEARTNLNLLGVLDSNRCNFTIIDTSGELVLNGQEDLVSEAKIELFENRKTGNGSVYTTAKGVYFVDGWNNTMKGNNMNTLYANCYDRLAYIGQKELPNLDKLSEATAGNVLRCVFEKLGLVEGTDYTIDSSLNLDLVYAVTKGDKVRDTLNEIAQALLARITVDRSGVIRVRPAFYNAKNYSIAGILSDKSGRSFNIKNNKDIGNYTYVKVGYVNPSIEEIPSILATRLSEVIEANNQKEVSFEIPQNTQVVDAIQCRCPWTSTGPAVECVSYNRTQSGLLATIRNNADSDITADLIVKGKNLITSNAYEYDSTKDTSGSVFKVDNIYIQSAAAARDFADDVKAYIMSIKNRFSISAQIDMEIECGTYIKVESTSSNISGVFYINALSFNITGNYQVQIDAIRVS